MNLISHGNHRAVVLWCRADRFAASVMPAGDVGGDVVQVRVTLAVEGLRSG